MHSMSQRRCVHTGIRYLSTGQGLSSWLWRSSDHPEPGHSMTLYNPRNIFKKSQDTSFDVHWLSVPCVSDLFISMFLWLHSIALPYTSLCHMPETHVSVLLRIRAVPRCENALAMRAHDSYQYDCHDSRDHFNTPTRTRRVLPLQIHFKDLKTTVYNWKIVETWKKSAMDLTATVWCFVTVSNAMQSSHIS